MHLSYPIAIAPCFGGQSVNDLLVSRVPVDVCCYFRGGVVLIKYSKGARTYDVRRGRGTQRCMIGGY